MSDDRPITDVEHASADSHNEEKDVSSGGAVAGVNSEDPEAPSGQVSSTRQKVSDVVTIIAAGAGLASDGCVMIQLPPPVNLIADA
jgi:hypothetical protein